MLPPALPGTPGAPFHPAHLAEREPSWQPRRRRGAGREPAPAAPARSDASHGATGSPSRLSQPGASTALGNAAQQPRLPCPAQPRLCRRLAGRWQMPGTGWRMPGALRRGSAGGGRSLARPRGGLSRDRAAAGREGAARCPFLPGFPGGPAVLGTRGLFRPLVKPSQPRANLRGAAGAGEAGASGQPG